MTEHEVQAYLADIDTNNIRFVGFFSTITGEEAYVQVDVEKDSAPVELLNILNDISRSATITGMSCPTQYTQELGYYNTLYFHCRERLPQDGEDDILSPEGIADIIMTIVVR